MFIFNFLKQFTPFNPKQNTSTKQGQNYLGFISSAPGLLFFASFCNKIKLRNIKAAKNSQKAVRLVCFYRLICLERQMDGRVYPNYKFDALLLIYNKNRNDNIYKSEAQEIRRLTSTPFPASSGKSDLK